MLSLDDLSMTEIVPGGRGGRPSRCHQLVERNSESLLLQGCAKKRSQNETIVVVVAKDPVSQRWLPTRGVFPAMKNENDITEILREWSEKSPGAVDQLIPLVVDELRLLARSHFRREPSGHTLQPTALINELYLRFVGQHSVQFGNRTEFFAFSSRLIRRILVDHHRERQRVKRGGRAFRITLSDDLETTSQKSVDLLALDKALGDLDQLDSRQHRVVELRFFGGLTNAQTAEVMSLSEATVKREWSTARAWLRHRMGP